MVTTPQAPVYQQPEIMSRLDTEKKQNHRHLLADGPANRLTVRYRTKLKQPEGVSRQHQVVNDNKEDRVTEGAASEPSSRRGHRQSVLQTHAHEYSRRESTEGGNQEGPSGRALQIILKPFSLEDSPPCAMQILCISDALLIRVARSE